MSYKPPPLPPPPSLLGQGKGRGKEELYQLLNSVFWCIYTNLRGSLTGFDCIRMQRCSYSRTYMWVEINKRCLLPWTRFFRRLFRSGTLVMMLGLNMGKLSMYLEIHSTNTCL